VVLEPSWIQAGRIRSLIGIPPIKKIWPAENLRPRLVRPARVSRELNRHWRVGWGVRIWAVGAMDQTVLLRRLGKAESYVVRSQCRLDRQRRIVTDLERGGRDRRPPGGNRGGVSAFRNGLHRTSCR
jgi:hypothetical protein